MGGARGVDEVQGVSAGREGSAGLEDRVCGWGCSLCGGDAHHSRIYKTKRVAGCGIEDCRDCTTTRQSSIPQLATHSASQQPSIPRPQCGWEDPQDEQSVWRGELRHKVFLSRNVCSHSPHFSHAGHARPRQHPHECALCIGVVLAWLAGWRSRYLLFHLEWVPLPIVCLVIVPCAGITKAPPVTDCVRVVQDD